MGPHALDRPGRGLTAVPGESGRRGRRDNGLDAAAFVPLVDVDPRVGEHLLDVLGVAGVPAYLEPSVDVEPYTRALSLPSPPTDRLWVDRDQRLRARQIVEAETPHGTRPKPTPRDDEPSHGLSDRDEERAWQQIVAGWNAPAREDTGPRDDPGPQDGGQPDPEDPGDRPRHGPIDRIGPDGHRHADGPRITHAGRTGTHPWDDTELYAEPEPDRRRRRPHTDTDQVTGADLDAAPMPGPRRRRPRPRPPTTCGSPARRPWTTAPGSTSSRRRPRRSPGRPCTRSSRWRWW